METEVVSVQSTFLDEKINNIAKQEGYVTYEIEKRNISNGGGYMGTNIAYDVKGKAADGNKETNIFVKQIIHPEIRMIYDMPTIYKREKFVYTDLLKEMFVLQETANVPNTERFKVAKAFDECDDQNIILENLTTRGFKTYETLDIVNLEYTELATKSLAKLHGLSLAMQIKRPNYFEQKIKNMDCIYIFDEYFHGFTHNLRKTVTEFLPEELREKLTPRLIKAVDNYQNYMNDASCSVKTVCHGDYRPNNVMVKETDGKPTEVIPVDYQLTFFGNPVLDFIYFIFWGTDQQFRKDHLQHLKQLYHQHLGYFLRYFSIDIEEVFPKEEFEKQYKEKLDFGLAISILYLPFIFPKHEDVINFQETTKPLDQLEFKIDDKFSERFRGIVDDFIKWGYL